MKAKQLAPKIQSEAVRAEARAAARPAIQTDKFSDAAEEVSAP